MTLAEEGQRVLDGSAAPRSRPRWWGAVGVLIGLIIFIKAIVPLGMYVAAGDWQHKSGGYWLGQVAMGVGIILLIVAYVALDARRRQRKRTQT